MGKMQVYIELYKKAWILEQKDITLFEVLLEISKILLNCLSQISNKNK